MGADPLELEPLFRADGPPRALWRKAALLVAAAFFGVLGVVFWLLPGVPGVQFYVLGALCLAAGSRRGARWLNRCEARLPTRWRVGLRRWLARRRAPERDG